MSICQTRSSTTAYEPCVPVGWRKWIAVPFSRTTR